MDSATTAAMARREGFEVYALSVRYGQRHAVELEAARRVAARARRRRATWSSTSTCAPSAAPPSPRPAGAQGHAARARSARASRPPTSRPATPSSSPSRSPGPRPSARATSSSGQRPRLQRLPRLPAGVHRRLTPGWRTWPPAPGSRARRLTIHTPLIALTKAEIVRRGLALGSTTASPAPATTRRPTAPPAAAARPACSGSRGSRRRACRTRRGTQAAG